MVILTMIPDAIHTVRYDRYTLLYTIHTIHTIGVFLMILDQTDSIVVNRGKKIVPLITIAALAVYTLQR